MHRSNPRKTAGLHRVILGALGAAAVMLASTVSWAADASNHVRDVKLTTEAEAGATVVEIAGTSTPTYSLRVVDNGKRLLLDIQNADVAGAQAALTQATGLVGGVLTQAFKGDGGTSMTRVSVALLKPAAYRVQIEGQTLRLSLTPSDATAPAKGPAPTKAASLAELQSVRFDRDLKACTGACDKVVVQLSRSASYSVTTAPGGQLRLELKKTKIADGVERAIDLAAQKGLIKSIATRYDAERDATVVEIDREGDAQGALSVEDGVLVWAFETPKAALAAAKKPDPKQPSLAQRKTITVAREATIKDLPKVETSILGDEGPSGEIKVETVGGAGQAGFVSGIAAQAGRYNGRRIDLDLKDADIHNILRLLADVGRVNIVTADDVSGSITIRMKNVPWDQALDVVLQAKGLGMVRSGNLIRVAPLAQLQKERELRLAAAKQEYELTPLETRLIPVSYATADELQARAKDLLSPRGSIAVDERTNVLIARDISGNLNNIEELVRSLDTQTPQVLIEARIVEANDQFSRNLGAKLGYNDIRSTVYRTQTVTDPVTGATSQVNVPVYGAGQNVVGGTYATVSGNLRGVADLSSQAGTNISGTNAQGLGQLTAIDNTNFVNLPAAAVGGVSPASFAISLFGSSLTRFLNLELSALEADQRGKVVSSPRVLTADQAKATIEQGTELPYQQSTSSGATAISFRKANLKLEVIPQITPEGNVILDVQVNRDAVGQLTPSGFAINTRQVKTQVLVENGGTVVIGGIFTQTEQDTVNKVPLLGDIPFVGMLFQNKVRSVQKTELLVFITPKIVTDRAAVR